MTFYKSEDYLMILKAISEVAIIAYTDKQGRITFANKNFCEISGYSLEELLHQDHRILNSGHHNSEFFKEMYQALLSGKIWRGEICNKNKNGGYYWVDSQVFAIMNEDNHIASYASIRFDITEKKRIQCSILQLEKLASLGEISAVVAHEINNPLAIIELVSKSLLNEMKKEVPDINHVEVKINKITKSTNQIAKIVRGLKTISRNGNLEDFSEINLKNFMVDALSFSSAKCRQNEIFLKIGEIPDIQIECRPDQISQILLNLINNAQDAIWTNKERWIELSVNSDDHLNILYINIIDSGEGIADHIAKKILDPFFTTKEVGKGTGLGLSISATIARDNGRLYYEKKRNNTAFVLEIPMYQGKLVKKN
ncbi:MAG: PAS domain S-box protein [Bacteriovorax sp.]|nr:PAS domain S-box protein [Bacteriovorax sp.]